MPWRMRSIMVSGGMLVRICMIMRLTQNACLVTHRIGVVFTSSMGWYTEEQRVIVRAYWKTESIKSPSHNIYIAPLGIRKISENSSIQYLLKKLETTETLLDIRRAFKTARNWKTDCWPSQRNPCVDC